MKYILSVVASLALIMPPVFAADAPAAQSAPVKKGKLMLAKKKDHSQAATPKPTKSKKSKK